MATFLKDCQLYLAFLASLVAEMEYAQNQDNWMNEFANCFPIGKQLNSLILQLQTVPLRLATTDTIIQSCIGYKRGNARLVVKMQTVFFEQKRWTKNCLAEVDNTDVSRKNF